MKKIFKFKGDGEDAKFVGKVDATGFLEETVSQDVNTIYKRWLEHGKMMYLLDNGTHSHNGYTYSLKKDLADIIDAD